MKKTLGILIRKKNNSDNKITKKLLKKEILTVWRKLKKQCNLEYMMYVIQSDLLTARNTYYIHCILPIEESEYNIIQERLSKYIKGNLWEKEKQLYRDFDICVGIYGKVHIQWLVDVERHKEWIHNKNKDEDIIQLY
jgi:hypothetical protein